jgi:hypothetical protein
MWPTPATRDHHAQGANHNPIAQSSSLATVVQKKGEQGEGTADPSDAVNRVPRLKALGNAIVPAVAHIFALAIYEQLSKDLTRH